MHRHLVAVAMDAVVDGVVDVEAVDGTVVDSVGGIVEDEKDRVAEHQEQVMLHNLVMSPRRFFNCGKVGHFARDCRLKTAVGGSGGNGRGGGQYRGGRNANMSMRFAGLKANDKDNAGSQNQARSS